MISLSDAKAAIAAALKQLAMPSPAAADLLLGTAIQESGLEHTRQLGGGPALGYWQMEPATHDDIWTNYLSYRPTLGRSVAALLTTPGTSRLLELETNPRYGAAMARLKYLRSPLPLPVYGDLEGYAHLWKTAYNTAGGAGTEAEFIANWRRVMAPQPIPAAPPAVPPVSARDPAGG